MLALSAANVVGVVLFGTLYAVAGARVLSQGAFLTCLAVLFALITALWVRTESRHRALPVWRRIGRGVVSLVSVVVLTPAAVLAPMFWLDEQIPPEAGLHDARGGIMALVLITLVLVALVNVVGAAVAGGRALLGGRASSHAR